MLAGFIFGQFQNYIPGEFGSHLGLENVKISKTTAEMSNGTVDARAMSKNKACLLALQVCDRAVDFVLSRGTLHQPITDSRLGHVLAAAVAHEVIAWEGVRRGLRTA